MTPRNQPSRSAKQKPSLGSALRELREEAAVSRSALARSAEIDVSTLARLEYGERATVNFEALCRIAEALNTSLDEIAARAGLLRRRGRRGGSAGVSAIAALEALQRVSSITSAALEVIRPKTRRPKRR